VTVGISGYSEFASQVEAGALRLIAVTADQRVPGVDAPTLREAGVDMALQNWRMVAAAPGITDEQKAAINADIEKLVQSESWKKALADRGWVDTYLAGAEFETQLAADIAATEAILKDIGLVQ
jgi:putative tricarboxylic transport membrane protein